MSKPAAGSDRDRCREGLTSVIDGLATLGCRLESLLEAEEAALRAADIEAIETLGQEKSERVESMDALEAERRTLLDGAGFGSGSADLERCIDWCNGDPGLIGRWNELLATTARCRELNQRNAAVGRVRHEQIRNHYNLALVIELLRDFRAQNRLVVPNDRIWKTHKEIWIFRLFSVVGVLGGSSGIVDPDTNDFLRSRHRRKKCNLGEFVIGRAA